jgi:hypothetical protein
VSLEKYFLDREDKRMIDYQANLIAYKIAKVIAG